MSFIESSVIDMIEDLGTHFNTSHIPNLQQAVQHTQNTISKLEGIVSKDSQSVQQQFQVHLNVYNRAISEFEELVSYLAQHAGELRAALGQLAPGS